MSKVKLLKDEALANLKSDEMFQQNKEHYVIGDKDYFVRIFEEHGCIVERDIEFDDIQIDKSEDNATCDKNNARAVYSALKHLSLAIATSEEFWTEMAHNEMWDFVQHRRREEISSGIDKKILGSFMYQKGNGKRRSLAIHPVSRLWLAGHIAYDEGREDPFELVDVLTDRNSFASDFMAFASSNMTAHENVAKGVLESALKQKKLGNPVYRKHFLVPLNYLNMTSGITVVDTFTREEVTELADKIYRSKEFGELANSKGSLWS